MYNFIVITILSLFIPLQVMAEVYLQGTVVSINPENDEIVFLPLPPHFNGEDENYENFQKSCEKGDLVTRATFFQ